MRWHLETSFWYPSLTSHSLCSRIELFGPLCVPDLDQATLGPSVTHDVAPRNLVLVLFGSSARFIVPRLLRWATKREATERGFYRRRADYQEVINPSQRLDNSLDHLETRGWLCLGGALETLFSAK
jgi:hypothetical protein